MRSRSLASSLPLFRAVQRQVAFERRRAVADEPHQVGHDAELLLDVGEQGFGGFEGLLDGRDADA